MNWMPTSFIIFLLFIDEKDWETFYFQTFRLLSSPRLHIIWKSIYLLRKHFQSFPYKKTGELPTYKQKMACKVTLLCFSIILSVFFHFVCGQNHEDIDKDNSVILPPCAACTTLVNSFLSKLKINSVEFDSILAQTCSGIY